MKKIAVVGFFGLGVLFATTIYFKNTEDSQASLVQEPDKPVEQAKPAQEVSATGPVSREQDLHTEQEKKTLGKTLTKKFGTPMPRTASSLIELGIIPQKSLRITGIIRPKLWRSS